jgi:hypothetical protein
LFKLVQTVKKDCVFIHLCITCVGYTCAQNLSSKRAVFGGRKFVTRGLDETRVFLVNRCFHQKKPWKNTQQNTVENPARHVTLTPELLYACICGCSHAGFYMTNNFCRVSVFVSLFSLHLSLCPLVDFGCAKWSASLLLIDCIQCFA